jgi:hypothetical protein
MTNIQHKDWCLTIQETSSEPIFNELTMSYMVFQLEIAPTTNKEHYQCFIQFIKKIRLTGVKKIFPSAHIEPRRGTSTQAAEYCMKTDTRKPDTNFRVYGELTGQGQRTDLQEIINCIREHKDPDEYQHSATYIRNKRNLDTYYQDQQPDRSFKPTVYWIYGTTGTGKSRYVYDYATSNNLTVWPGNKDYNSFWNGYENQDIVLMDDYRYDHCKFNKLLEYLDRYPCNVNVKGGYRKLNSKIFFIISNNTPQEVYKFDDGQEQMKQLIRRLDYVIEKHQDQELIIPEYQTTESKSKPARDGIRSSQDVR